jgi:hypothetical protein
MSPENLPQEPEDIINIASKSGYLKVDTDIGEVKLNSYNQIEIQPKGTILGAKLKVEENGEVSPMITFDTKKLKSPKKDIDPKQILDDALEDFFNEQN